MNLEESFEFVAGMNPAWKTARGVWRTPAIYNRDHCLRLLGKTTNVKRITKADLATMRAELLREGRANGGVNRIMSILNTCLKELCENEIIDKYPKLKQLDEGKGRQEYYTRQNISDMVRVAKEKYGNLELADAILFGVFTGCRQANLLGLEVRDVDFNNDTINFRETKNGDDHIVDIHPDLNAILLPRCENKDPYSRVFEFRNKDDLWNAFKKVRNDVGLDKRYVWHSLRHTCGSWLAEAEVPVQTIASILGHKTLEMSMRYTHINNKVRKTAINKL